MKARFLYRAWKARFRGERGEIRALLERLAPGDAAVDVGANKGAYLYWMRRAVGPGGSVIAFEPQPGLARYLEDVRARMAWQNVSIRDCALSDSSGRRVLHVPGWENSPGASLEALEALDRRAPPGTRSAIARSPSTRSTASSRARDFLGSLS